jgi:hypothetical protein
MREEYHGMVTHSRTANPKPKALPAIIHHNLGMEGTPQLDLLNVEREHEFTSLDSAKLRPH